MELDPATGRNLSSLDQRVKELLEMAGHIRDTLMPKWVLVPHAGTFIRLAVELKRWSVSQLAKIGEPSDKLGELLNKWSIAITAHEISIKKHEKRIEAIEDLIVEIEGE